MESLKLGTSLSYSFPKDGWPSHGKKLKKKTKTACLYHLRHAGAELAWEQMNERMKQLLTVLNIKLAGL